MIRDTILDIIENTVQKTAELKAVAKDLDYSVERPRIKKYGDWSTNVAMVAAPLLKKSPMQIAETVVENIDDPQGLIETIDIAKPGFINFSFKDEWYRQIVKRIEELDEKYGELTLGKGIKVLLEYVSANPVGPLHIGHGRWAAVGDSLARTLKKAGFEVSTEFYVNNHGRQMDLYYESVASAYKNVFGDKTQPPEDGYKGAYIVDIAKEIKAKYDKPLTDDFRPVLEKEAFLLIEDQIRNTLKHMGVVFDLYFKEKEDLHEKDAVKKTVGKLKKDGEAYEKEGAVWLDTSKHGDEKDRVLIRSNDEPTYFLADIAYHKNKLDRGFDKLINIWGADHHGYVARVKASIAALGDDPDKLIVVLGQLVNLMKDGKTVKMSKRTGELITLDELIDEVGVDAIRYTFLTKSTDTAIDFDIDLVKEQSDKNPVYYVQYSHARICSILAFAESKGIKYDGENVDLSLIKEPAEIGLVKILEEFEDIVEAVSKNYTPHLLTIYASKLAATFHSFYAKVRVVNEDDNELTQARLALLNATHITLRNVLLLLGVSAPEKM